MACAEAGGGVCCWEWRVQRQGMACVAGSGVWEVADDSGTFRSSENAIGKGLQLSTQYLSSINLYFIHRMGLNVTSWRRTRKFEVCKTRCES